METLIGVGLLRLSFTGQRSSTFFSSNAISFSSAGESNSILASKFLKPALSVLSNPKNFAGFKFRLFLN
jgi:hypothetical protein